MVFPVPPPMGPTLIWETLWFGLMLSSSLPLWLTVKPAVQPRPSAPGSRTLVLTLNAIPRFRLLPTFVLTRFVRFVPAGTRTVDLKRLGVLVYVSNGPLMPAAARASNPAR